MAGNELESILRLLDDPDEQVYSVVRQRLYESGISVLKRLEETWEHSDNPLLQHRIEMLTQSIQSKFVHDNVETWCQAANHDLLAGLYWIAKYQYPDLDYKYLEVQVNSIIQDIENEITGNLTPLDLVRVINHVFFQVHRYTRVLASNESPQNFFINNVISEKKGNAWSLTVLYAAIAQRMGLPVYALNLPENFTLAYIDSKRFHEPFNSLSSVFFINPANKGAVFGRFEIDDFLTRVKIAKQDNHYTPSSNIQAIQLYIEQIKLVYLKMGYKNKVSEYQMLLNIVRQHSF